MRNPILRTTKVAALAAAVLLTGCGSEIKADATLITIDKGDAGTDTITLGYANFVARYQQSLYDQYMLAYYGEDMWSQDLMGIGYTMEDQTKSGIITDIEEMYVTKEHAADYDIALTDEQNTAISEAAAKFLSDNSEETLEELGATEEYVKRYLEEKTIYKLVESAVEEAADADITEDDCWMRTFSYVEINTSGTDASTGVVTEYTDEELEAFKEQAESIASAEDFDAEVEKQGLTASSYSYLKGEEEDDTMDMAIIEAAEALDEGEVSSVIEIEGAGYYVLKLTSDHDTDASETERENLKSEAFTNAVDEWIAAYEWTVDDDQWAKVTFTNLFKAPETEEETTDTDTEETVEETTDDTTEDSEETTEESTDDSADESAE